MTAFTQTITNSVNCLGGGGSSLWNAYNWNAFVWGEGTVGIGQVVTHLISESVSSTDAPIKSATHLIEESVTASGMEVYRAYAYQIFETVTLSGDATDEYLQDGSGYSYVFPDRVTDADQRSFASWTKGTPDTETWATATAATTTWSQA